MIEKFFKKWWNDLCYEPGDPRKLAGRRIRIVVIGGGTGLAVMLKGLKKYSNEITAIVSVMDDGSSSGRLRREFDMLPPGDIRKCISALSHDEDLVENLMEFRFIKNRSSLTGHTLGNIWITALTKYFGSFERAIEATTEIFETAGKVLPSTLSNVELMAQYDDGSTVIGESKIPNNTKKIEKISLSKKHILPYAKSIEAIDQADLILVGPGSLFTSVIPNLLIPKIRKAIENNRKAIKIYIANCSTERGETENFTIEDHIEAIKNHTKTQIFNYCLVNKKIIKRSSKISTIGEINNITTKSKEISGCQIILDNLINEKKPLFHDSEKLANAIIELYNKARI